MNNGYSNSGGLPHYDGGLNGLENSMDQEGDDADGDSTEAYADGGSTEAYADGGSTEGSALDHALLESLFYNEMMMLESDPLSSNFITQHLSEASAPVARHAPPEVVAEKALLRDFGVTSHAAMLHNSAAEAPLETARTEASSWIHEPELPSPPMVTVKQHAPSHYYPTRTESVSAPPRAPVRSAPPAPIYSTHSSSSYVEPFALSIAPSASVASASSEAIAPQMPVSDERAKQLVSQFATLASRLGIDLPSNVLQSLTRQAALNEPPKKNSAGIQHAISAATAGANTYYADDTALDNSDPEDQNQEEFDNTTLPPTTTSTTDVAPTVQELRRTAEEAIAAVSRNRSHDDSNHGNNNESGSGKPLYSKRRKKPRLPDCESKLAALKAENDLLKRHLQNVSSKAQRFDQEKNEAGKRIKRLLEEGAGPEEMNKVVQDFTDMYSDYGRRRQQELSFHLEQLQRLVNPTNFTKMGLWTLGQDSTNPKRNPIAGILQKELDITAQQGRKIIEQREKIQALCDNLKECLALLAKLKSLCEQKTSIFHHRMSKCREILTSKQVVKLIIWIHDNTGLLETVCPGWGTEHIQSKRSSGKS